MTVPLNVNRLKVCGGVSHVVRQFADIQPLASRSSGSRRRKVRRACAASRCTPAGLTCRAAVTCVKQDHPPRGARLRVPFFHAAPYKRALGSWDGCKRFRGAVVCAMFARQGVKGRSAWVFGVYTGGSPWRVHTFARGPSGFQSLSGSSI